MDPQKPFGLYLFKKPLQTGASLKELLQFLKTTSPVKGQSFSYVEPLTSLHPGLSLSENIQLEIGPFQWREFQQSLGPEWLSLVSLLRDPSLSSEKSLVWEKFIVALVKGRMTPTQNLLIEMNEDLYSPFVLQRFKKSILEASREKRVFLSSANTSLWLDCAHTLVEKKEFRFEVKVLGEDMIKRHWVA